MGGKRLDEAKCIAIRKLLFGGVRPTHVASALGCSLKMIYKTKRASPWPPRAHSDFRLCLWQREEISRGLQANESIRNIARGLNRNPSTISREVEANGGRAKYRAWRAQRRADELARRPKPGKLEGNTTLSAAVEKMLVKNWSPEQIARRLRLEHPDDPNMNVSHETIYRALYIQGRGTLRNELTKHLRTKRAERRKPSRAELRGHIKDMINISERPPSVEDRAVPGHWEGDLIIGKDGNSAMGTLVERKTRYLMLLQLRDGRSAEHVRQALTKKIQQLPVELRRSLTWDQGKEMSQHAQFTVDTGVTVYFCDPHSPWQRGSNENTNGLLRQYFPKGTVLSRYSEEELDAVARELNERPRQTLHWHTPSEALDEVLR
jgi:IS30 family transposase